MNQKMLLAADHIDILKRQEETTYKCLDYLSLDYQTQQTRQSVPNTCLLGSKIQINNNSDIVMQEVWREKICEWSYNLIDYFNYDREFVSLSMNFLDRYVMRKQVDTKTYQLAAMTSIFIVVKMYQPRCSALQLDVSSFVKLSQSAFNEDNILAMEREIFETLEWRLFPPTPNTFMRHLWTLVIPPLPRSRNSRGDHKELEEIMELARFFTELSVCDYFFVTHKPSTIGVASLFIAIDATIGDGCLPSGLSKETFMERVFVHTGISFLTDSNLQACLSKLERTYRDSFSNQQQEQQNSTDTEAKNSDSAVANSNSSSAVIQDDDKESIKNGNDSTRNEQYTIPSPVCVSGAAIICPSTI
jgi:hypothetical protein